MNRTRTAIQSFSDGYFILDNANVIGYGGEMDAVIPNDMETQLRKHVTRPLLKIDGTYYWPESQVGVPADTIAINGAEDIHEDSEIFLTKDEHTVELVETGQVPPP